VTVCE